MANISNVTYYQEVGQLIRELQDFVDEVRRVLMLSDVLRLN